MRRELCCCPDGSTFESSKELACLGPDSGKRNRGNLSDSVSFCGLSLGHCADFPFRIRDNRQLTLSLQDGH
jgi:hypothetical protein